MSLYLFYIFNWVYYQIIIDYVCFGLFSSCSNIFSMTRAKCDCLSNIFRSINLWKNRYLCQSKKLSHIHQKQFKKFKRPNTIEKLSLKTDLHTTNHKPKHYFRLNGQLTKLVSKTLLNGFAAKICSKNVCTLGLCRWSCGSPPCSFF